MSASSRPKARTPGILLGRGIMFSVLLVLLAEGLLRLGGRPLGRYQVALSGASESELGPWEAGFRAVLESGPVPYRVTINGQGFRGAPLRRPEDPADLRIAAIGDSFTEGFYVDDEDCYPAQLQLALEATGRDVEVINAARGGGSIDRSLQILERCVLPLKPDLVLVTFVTNDLADLGWFPLEAPQHLSLAKRLGARFVGHTALGEWMLEVALGSSASARDLGPARYQIEGADQYALNAGLFLQRYGDLDGQVLGQTLSPVLQAGFEIYRAQLRSFVQRCAMNQIEVLLIYVPAYPEIYVERKPSIARRLLAAEAKELGIAFVDLTEGLRQASLGESLGPLHLAPLDFHFNPLGNRIMAREVARALELGGLLPSGAPR